VTSEEVFLRDLGSRNGTLVNGVRVQEERALNDGDEVHIGPLVFKVLIEEPRPEELVSAKPGEVVHVVSLTGTEPVLGTLTTAEQPAFPAANSAKKR
jgi:pSer/pThr/pTyr-binding forkhead associated (FHA) protein